MTLIMPIYSKDYNEIATPSKLKVLDVMLPSTMHKIFLTDVNVLERKSSFHAQERKDRLNLLCFPGGAQHHTRVQHRHN